MTPAHLARFKVITEELAENPEMCGQMPTDAAQWRNDALMYLLGSRYCDTQKLSKLRWPLLCTAHGGRAPAYTIFAATDFGRDVRTVPYPFRMTIIADPNILPKSSLVLIFSL